MVKALIITLILSIAMALTSCGGQDTAPSWAEFQYENAPITSALTECGPTVAANSLCFQTGICRGKEYARGTRQSPAWWRMAHIQYFINQEGGSAELRNFSQDELLRNLGRGLSIIHINGTHFVTVFRNGSTDYKWDTNSGLSIITNMADITRTVSYGKYIFVPKI